ncbi:hypothetical protein ENSA5_21720 [Enhygromyxa salina]|uniref:Uncharacterized protein n=1 Tax=Enhygromyxa salina TaxID=215803 RepID=A0A2S9YBM9_9BACT|nr:hypothetical protein [Enhygromyxa salina]PRQ02527.1 hypothetical protein ENSA5_21720 [Enhygromyxa salina]
MKTIKELRISDLQQVRGAADLIGGREEYSKNCEDGDCKSSEIGKQATPKAASATL